MGTKSVPERNAAVVAAITRGVSLDTVCRVYDVDVLTVRRAMGVAGEKMPLDSRDGGTPIGTREAEMLRRALEGEEFSVIARSFDVSREWVRLVVKRKTGLGAKDLKAIRDDVRHRSKVRQMQDLANGDADLPLDELAKQSGLSVREVEHVLGRAEAARRRSTRSVPSGVERADALAEIRRVAALSRRSHLSGPFYDQHRVDGVSSIRLIQMFGTWTNACEQAGVRSTRAVRENYTQKWGREECLRWVLKYLESTDKPSFDRYDSWSRSEEGAPSGGTVRLRCGRWIEAVRDAYELQTADS
ncbi:hypothetical protein [uncultured Dietzia sp.]|uniref:hypothetical protein n=1 Tax=uncultured Dietzia sp. TaxID=395519 RepID=UPI0025EF38AD|nr:hypothetical protein [uncultured Dietzia sp.]